MKDLRSHKISLTILAGPYDSFTKQDFRIYKASSKFTKYCARNSKWPSKPPPISTPANVLARCRKCHTCHSDEKRRKSSLSGKTTLQTSKCPGNPTPATKTRIFPKTDAACRQEGTSARELCKKMEYISRNFFAVVTKLAGHGCTSPESYPAWTLPVRPKCEHTVWRIRPIRSQKLYLPNPYTTLTEL